MGPHYMGPLKGWDLTTRAFSPGPAVWVRVPDGGPPGRPCTSGRTLNFSPTWGGRPRPESGGKLDAADEPVMLAHLLDMGTPLLRDPPLVKRPGGWAHVAR